MSDPTSDAPAAQGATAAAPAPAAAADATVAADSANATAEPAPASSEPMADAAASSDGASASAAPVVRMKKIRKRGASKISASSATLDGEDDDEADGSNGAGGGGGKAAGDSLQTIRLMQKLRSKGATVLALGEGTLALAAEAAAAESASAAAAGAHAAAAAAAEPPIGKEFGASAEGKDAQSALIDEQMEKYIAEQMAARRALRAPQKPAASSSSSAAAAPAVNLSDEQLFDLAPVQLAVSSSSSFAALADAEESGERWLTGIAEVGLSVKDKMRNIEKTEEAKARMLREMDEKRRAARNQEAMILPANYNSNFKLHKKEWDGRRREEFRAFNDAQNRAAALAAGLPVPAPSALSARDAAAAALPAASDPKALPGFLAVTEETRGPFVPRPQGVPGQPGYKPGVPNATDDRVVDRFIKRFKYK